MLPGATATPGNGTSTFTTNRPIAVDSDGLDPAKLVLPHGEGGVGGPYIPAELDANALVSQP